MSDSIRSAATIAEDRLKIASQVQALRDELLTASEEVRAEKAADLQSLCDQFEKANADYEMAELLEEANRKIEALSRQPQRPVAKSYDPSKIARVDKATGQVIDAGDLAEVDGRDALASNEYQKAFQALAAGRFRIENVKSRYHRDMLERYGKGGDDRLSANEFFMPFSKDMTIASSTNGSNVIAPDFRFDIITPRTVSPVMARLANVITTNVTSVTFPKNSDANADTRYGTTFRPTKGESPNGTANKKDTGPFTSLVIPVNTGTMFTDVSEDLFMDAPGLSSYLQSEASKAFAAVVDDEMINGVTGSTQAEGLLTNASVGITKTGTANTLVPAKIVDAFYAFRSQYSNNLAWVMARGTHGKLVNLLDTTNRSLFMPDYNGGYNQGPTAQLLGQPVYFNEFVPASGASSPKSMIVGNFQEYLLLIRQGFTIKVDDMSQAHLNRTRVVMKYRFGGAVRDPRAFQIVHEAV